MVREQLSYGQEDIKILVNILSTHHFRFLATVQNILSKHKGSLQEQDPGFGPFLEEEKAFLFRTPFKEVPKFINTVNLKAFVEWRLKIGK